MKNRVTICALLYGDYPELAERCLGSICRAAPEVLPAGLRIGMNVCSTETNQYVGQLVSEGQVQGERVYRANFNIHKYPMMRRMLYDSENPITTPYVMWFDDDSYVKIATACPSFLELAMLAITTPFGDNIFPDMLGSKYSISLRDGQRRWIEDQPWYTGAEIPAKPYFATGGWWVARTEMLRKLDYPWPCLDHRGGDVMLGVAMAQQGFHLRHRNRHVAINANINGHESQADRRGFNQPPIGAGYVRPAPFTPPTSTAPAARPTFARRRLIDTLDL